MPLVCARAGGPLLQPAAWDRFVQRCTNGTLFHRLAFLAYHRSKFTLVEHHLVWHRGTTPVAVMPMALREEEGQLTARSPYVGSYGGPVHEGPLNYRDSAAMGECKLA